MDEGAPLAGPLLKGPLLRTLKARAQRLDPLIRLGRNGPSGAFYAALDAALEQHELVKIKFEEFKEQKKALSPQIATRSGSHIVMRVGNVLVLYRPRPDPTNKDLKNPASG